MAIAGQALPAASDQVTVCVTTKNRGDSVVATLLSLAACEHGAFEVIVVDQSTDRETAEAIHAQAPESLALTYVRSSESGAARGRNAAARLAKGSIIAYTDDDCRPSPDWLPTIVEHFRSDPTLGQINGCVVPAPYDGSAGLIPAYVPSRSYRISSPWMKWRDRGVSANTAVRASVLREIGYFDEMLGAGTGFDSGEDYDLTYRVLKAGHRVLNAADVRVCHYGFRTWAEASELMRRTGTGIGAAYAKHLRAGDLAILPTLIIEFPLCISWRRLLLLRRRTGLARLASYIRGLFIGFRSAVDPVRHVFMSEPGGPAGETRAEI